MKSNWCEICKVSKSRGAHRLIDHEEFARLAGRINTQTIEPIEIETDRSKVYTDEYSRWITLARKINEIIERLNETTKGGEDI